MLVGGRAGNQDIIQIHKHPIKAAQNLVHQSLKGLGGVLQAEGHPDELKEAEGRYDRRLLHVFGRHRDLVVSPNQVQDGEKLGAEGDRRKGVNVG